MPKEPTEYLYKYLPAKVKWKTQYLLYSIYSQMDASKKITDNLIITWSWMCDTLILETERAFSSIDSEAKKD